MSPSGLVITRDVQPAPGPLVQLVTVLAAKSRSGAFVATAGVLLDALAPPAEAATSTGLTGSMPEYSSTRTSGNWAGRLKETATGFQPTTTTLRLPAVCAPVNGTVTLAGAVWGVAKFIWTKAMAAGGGGGGAL